MEIKEIQTKDEKRSIIEKCDCVFDNGLVKRPDYLEKLEKIHTFATFFAAYAEELVGYAAIYTNDTKSQVAYITMIGIVKDKQGMHIGSRLMEKCIETAKSNNMHAIRLEVLNNNIRAISFYKHFGFSYETECSENSSYMLKKLS